MNFNNFEVAEPILRAIKDLGFEAPTPIQQKAIPIVLQGQDIIGCAQTGTGKTAAFAIPIIHLLGQSGPEAKGHPQALILAPTRELALQIKENFDSYAQYTKLRISVIFGGVSQKAQVDQIKRGVDVLIATPGRLLDLIGQGLLKIDKVKYLVLDEADSMLDMGFVHDIKKVLRFLPSKRQTLFFSATMPGHIRKFAETILTQPKEVNAEVVSSAAVTVRQSVFFVDKKQKMKLLCHLLKDEHIEQSLVFTRTKYGADRLAKQLFKQGIQTASIHGNKTQNARQNALSNFKNGTVKVLIATDIAARGIDINDLPHVVNFDLPNDSETYVHRIGRTGRAGKDGIAISFCSEEERKELKNIQKLIGFQLEAQKHKFVG
ncbi:MAG: DEAD/DEAH box helicase [Sphingobacterium sp.]